LWSNEEDGRREGRERSSWERTLAVGGDGCELIYVEAVASGDTDAAFIFSRDVLSYWKGSGKGETDLWSTTCTLRAGI
jgi:hypothetical protein